MHCNKCGKHLHQNAKYCTNCGGKVEKRIAYNSKKVKREVCLEFTDTDGQMEKRSSGADFDSLSQRHIDVLSQVPGLDEDEELKIWLGTAMDTYNGGWYERSLKYLSKSLDRSQNLEPFIFYYIRVCERVLATELTESEILYKNKLQRYINRRSSLPKWLHWLLPNIDLKVRCKWCGKYTKFVSPNDNSFGFIAGGINSCKLCGMSYPAPSWMWDSPDGRAYSYYRQSFPTGRGGEQFYAEFLEDYDPKPTVEESGLFGK